MDVGGYITTGFFSFVGGMIAVIFSLVLLDGANARAESYRDGALHYALELPRDWQAMPAVEVQKVNQLLRQRGADQSVSYEGGFRPKGRAQGGPYILIQSLRWVKMGGASYADIEKDLAETFDSPEVKEEEGAWGDLVKNAAFGAPVLDRSRNVVIVCHQADVKGTGKLQGLSVGHLGSEGVVVLHCNAKQQEFDHLLPTFQKINESFHFDPGYQFVPAAEPSARPRKSHYDWGGAIGGGAFGAIVGALIGGVVALAAWLFRKLRASPTSPGLPRGNQAESQELPPHETGS